MSKNQFIMMGIVLCCLFISCISGCVEEQKQNDDPSTVNSKFIGSWVVVSSVPDYETWDFYKNGSAKNFIIVNFEGQKYTEISWYSFNIENDTICLNSIGIDQDSNEYISICYDYEFTQNETRVSISFDNITAMVLERTG